MGLLIFISEHQGRCLPDYLKRQASEDLCRGAIYSVYLVPQRLVSCRQSAISPPYGFGCSARRGTGLIEPNSTARCALYRA